MDIDPEIPRLLIALSLAAAANLDGEWSAMRNAGVEGVVVSAGNDAPGSLVDPLRRVVEQAGSVPVLFAGAPSVAGAAGTGLVLPEGGIATAEARRQLRAGTLLGREISSANTASLAIGLDFLVAVRSGFAGGADSVRLAIEAAPVPILWRVAHADEAAAAVIAGAEGVIVEPAGDAVADAALLRQASALFPARVSPERLVVVDGASLPLVPDTAITDLLDDLGLAPNAVRRNGVPVPRRAWDDTLLSPGDVLETSR